MGRNEVLEFQAVLYLAEDKLAQANARIRRKGGNIRYELCDNDDGTFTIQVGRMYKDVDGLTRFKTLYCVFCEIDVYSVYYCACGIEDALTINYL